MPVGTHTFRCMACHQSRQCGDCIPQYCDFCQSQIDQHHPGPVCPCWGCVATKNEQSIQKKLNPQEDSGSLGLPPALLGLEADPEKLAKWEENTLPVRIDWAEMVESLRSSYIDTESLFPVGSLCRPIVESSES